MKRRIFASTCLASAIAVVLTSVIVLLLMQVRYEKAFRAEGEKSAEYIAAAVEVGGESYLKSLSTERRITLIASDGSVIFDNRAQTVENHAHRPEVIEAVETGKGNATRLSDTMLKKFVYSAVRLSDGRVLRVAETMDSLYAAARSGVPYILATVLLMLLLAVLYASQATRGILRPLREINLESPLENETYEELSPVLKKLEKQSRELSHGAESMRKIEGELAAISENMNEGLVIISAKETVLSMNRSAMRLFGIREADYTGRNILTIERSYDIIETVRRAGRGEAGETLLARNGRFCEVIVNPVITDGELNGCVMLLLDVTEKQQAEQMRREFSANVSHELKTPLQSITGYAEIMKDGLVKPEDMRPFAGRIYDEARRLVTLVSDIINLSRLDEGDTGAQHESVDLFALAESVSDTVSELAEKKGVTVRVSGAHACITGVPAILSEMLFNLVDNAVKYNRDGGRVDITIGENERHATVTVADTGIGIPAEHRQRVFERFYRVDKSHSKESGGTGLGLSIVKHAAMFHNAEITLESRENEGTTITVSFPVA